MNEYLRDLNDIYTLSKVVECNEIKLSACTRNKNQDVLILYTDSGDFIYHNLDMNNPVIKQIPWLQDSMHAPVSIDLSPCGCFLLVLSHSCHLYIIPICAMFDGVFQCHSDSRAINTSDVTIHVYPFIGPGPKQNQMANVLANVPNSHFGNTSSAPLSMPRLSSKQKSFGSIGSHHLKPEFDTGENESKLSDISSSKSSLFPSAVCWWQSQQGSQEIAIIGLKTGEILFVDLVTGVKIGETSVKREIKHLSLSHNTSNDNYFLLITVDNKDQYKMVLDEKRFNQIWAGKQESNANGSANASANGSASEDGEGPQGQGSCHPPSSRNPLQGLKNISAEKFSSFKHKIAETRSKIITKQNGREEGFGQKVIDQVIKVPENLGSIVGDTFLSCQTCQGDNVLVGYYSNSHLLTIHSMSLELVPRNVYKLPDQTERVLFCDHVIYVIFRDRKCLQVISSKLAETKMDEVSDFNVDSVLGKWTFNDFEKELAQEDGTPPDTCHSSKENCEIIMDLYKTLPNNEVENEMGDICKVSKAMTDFEFPTSENCIVVTNRNVYVVRLKWNIVKVVLDLILDAHELEKAERICIIYGINLQKLLEVAGDIKLNTSDYPTAIALYKLSKCGLLKSIVKLACGSHCSQMLKYSLMLMTSSTGEMSLSEKIHLSNLIVMAYAQEVLRNENNQKLLEKYIEFLQGNTYFDEVLAISVTGQSLLFRCLHKLITYRGLILDGYNVIIKLMERFLNSRALDWTLNKEEFWKCVSDVNLIESIVVRPESFLIYYDFVSQHLDELDLLYINRLLFLLDPTGPCIRPLIRLIKNSNHSLQDEDSRGSSFPFGKLIELFLETLLVKLHKMRIGEEYRNPKWLLAVAQGTDERQTGQVAQASGPASDSERSDVEYPDEVAGLDPRWSMKKDAAEALSRENFKRKAGAGLACGYGHGALIRNGGVYTWGQTAKGCLGQGPTMARYSCPGPIPWLNHFKVEVSLVSCGKNHTAALTDNGLYTWGCSKYGQLGLGEVHESPHPRLVKALRNETISTVSCGQFHTVALTRQGSVFAWGWGVHGQLGLGSVDDQRLPKQVEALKEHVIVDVAAGHGHSLVLSDKGHVYAFGSSVFGQLGTGNTTKQCLPTLVKGIAGKVTSIASGYFHNLALTESDVLYSWGSSPQSLRLQAQARKRSKMHPNQSSSSSSSTPPPQPLSLANVHSAKAPASENVKSPVSEEKSAMSIQSKSDVHLSPSVVDTGNVSGKIVQMSCGCHHSALVTDSGGVYTWGRSMDGQLGNGTHLEVQIPTQITEKTFRADSVSCGCEFTVAQEKHTGKIYAWGSNSVGQLAIPVKESATKSLDGKLILLKSCKRIVRLLDRNSGINSVDVPKEIPGIPPPSFTYETLCKPDVANSGDLSHTDPEYALASFHFVLDNFTSSLNMNLILEKTLKYNNYQCASKIAFVQNDYQRSLTYQLKALQNCPKYQSARAKYSRNVGSPSSVQFEEESGPEESSEGSQLSYANDALCIIECYFRLNSKLSFANYWLLEIGIQFWINERLPGDLIETFLLTKTQNLCYDLAYLLFCQSSEFSTKLLAYFSSTFILEIISKLLTLISSGGNHVEFLETMSSQFSHKMTTTSDSLKKKTFTRRRRKSKSQLYVEDVAEKLRCSWKNKNYINISCGDVTGESMCFYSCGHSHSLNHLEREFQPLQELNDGEPTSKLIRFYDEFVEASYGEIACPLCVCNYLKQ